jgi:hypothetical protein
MHLAGCTGCRQVLAEEASLTLRLEYMPQVELKKDPWPVIAAAMAESPRSPSRRVMPPWRPRWVMLAAAVGATALALVGNVGGLRQSPSELAPADVVWVAPSMKYAPDDPLADLHNPMLMLAEGVGNGGWSVEGAEVRGR